MAMSVSVVVNVVLLEVDVKGHIVGLYVRTSRGCMGSVALSCRVLSIKHLTQGEGPRTEGPAT
jgi:hypothetical protein